MPARHQWTGVNLEAVSELVRAQFLCGSVGKQWEGERRCWLVDEVPADQSLDTDLLTGFLSMPPPPRAIRLQ